MWVTVGIAAMGAILIGGPLLFLLSLGSFINHMGGGEQDDDET